MNWSWDHIVPRVARAQREKFEVLARRDMSASCTKFVLLSASRQLYVISLQAPTTCACTCVDANDQGPCKHTLFVLINVRTPIVAPIQLPCAQNLSQFICALPFELLECIAHYLSDEDVSKPRAKRKWLFFD